MVANTRHRLALKSGPLSRNDAVEMGSATVPVAPVGVPPTRPRRSHPSPNGAFILRGGVFGGTPKRAGETPRAPNRTASFRFKSSEERRLGRGGTSVRSRCSNYNRNTVNNWPFERNPLQLRQNGPWYRLMALWCHNTLLWYRDTRLKYRSTM